MPKYLAPTALLPDGWQDNVLLEVDNGGDLVSVKAGPFSMSDVRPLGGPVLPGIPNLHSHAFQRGMAGLAERSRSGQDSFWSWRDVMYAFLRELSAEHVEVIAAQLFVEMLLSGYTAVTEFHYLHHGERGRPYEQPAEMSHRIGRAARRAGIGLTHLPVLYQNGGFGGLTPGDGQKRFVLAMDDYCDLVGDLARSWSGDRDRAVGLAFHSLRAVEPEAMTQALAERERRSWSDPIHIHVAEQRTEVDECVAWSGARPVAWLLDNLPVSEDWCLVHATHIDEAEAAGIADRGAVVGLCPSTEANLGDGLFPLAGFQGGGGRFGVGSDSQVSVSPIEELRWLEYGQRLAYETRNVASVGTPGSTGMMLLMRALAGGAQAAGRALGKLAPGARADLVVLDGNHPCLAGRRDDRIADAWIFAGNRNVVKDVMVGGNWVVQDGRHPEEVAIAAEFSAVMERLANVI